MSSQAPAGWYPDPAGTSGHRWWDGATWSESVAPAAAAPVATAPYSPAPQGYPQGYPPAGQAMPYRAGSQTPNKYALITFAVVAVYMIIAFESRVVIFGILPLGLAFRSKRNNEALAPFAIGAAVLAIVVAAVRIFGG